LEPAAVVVLVLVAARCGEQPVAEREPLLAEGLLLAQAVGVAAKVAL
jgi:hypothetical protein